MPTLLAVIYILDCGVGETPIDFENNYHASMISMGVLGKYLFIKRENYISVIIFYDCWLFVYLGSFAAACGDTWSSELGSVIRTAQPVLITNLKPVPRGEMNLLINDILKY